MAETKVITKQDIERLYMDEIKIPGATVQCFQAGKAIIYEPGLTHINIHDDGLNALRLDGSDFTLKTFKGDGATTCTIINRSEAK